MFLAFSLSLLAIASGTATVDFTNMRLKMLDKAHQYEMKARELVETTEEEITYFNDLTFGVKTVFYAKKMQFGEQALVYQDDTWRVSVSCLRDAPDDDSDDNTIIVYATNNNDFTIEGIMANEKGSFQGKTLSPHATEHFESLSRPYENDDDNQVGSMVNAALMLSDGHFIANHGEASISYDTRDQDDDDFYYDFIEHDRCGMAGFLQIAYPLKTFKPSDDDLSPDTAGLFESAPHVQSEYADGHNSLFHSKTSVSSSNSSSPFDAVFIALGAILGGTFAVFLSLKYAGISIKRRTHASISMDESMRNSLPLAVL